MPVRIIYNKKPDKVGLNRKKKDKAALREINDKEQNDQRICQ